MGIGIPFRFSRLHGLFMQVLACSREVFMFVDNVFAADGMEGPVRFQIFPHVQIMEEGFVRSRWPLCSEDFFRSSDT